MNAQSPAQDVSKIEIREWLSKYADDSRRQAAEGDWRSHESQSGTVLTLLGVYDSGKSSLLRRLLVDAGEPCPDWLTISARHETFEVAPVNISGLLLRDTPGLSTNAGDLRGQQNNRRALDAAGLTDVLALVVPPQLATSEIDDLRVVLNQTWPMGSLRCVISRFDEAGVDPTGDLDQYRALATRKTAELRESLGLSDDVPIHVVAPDAWQFAGESRQPDPTVWDMSRSWDGIVEFQTSLLALNPLPVEYRQAAASRFWVSVLLVEVRHLESQHQHAAATQTTVDQTNRRFEHISARIAELENGVRVELHAALGNVLDMALQSGVVDDRKLKDAVTDAVGTWLQQAHEDLRLLMQDVDAEFDRQMARPAWRDLVGDDEPVLAAATAEGGGNSPGSTDSRPDAKRPRLLQLNGNLAKSLKEVREVLAKRTSDYSTNGPRRPAASTPASAPTARTTGRAEGVLRTGEVLVALGPTLLDLYELVSEHQREQAQKTAQRANLGAIENKLQRIQTKVAEAALEAFSEDVSAARTVVDESAMPIRAMDAALKEQIALLEQALVEAEAFTRH